MSEWRDRADFSVVNRNLRVGGKAALDRIATRLASAEARVEEADDFRAYIVVEAFTAPDADWDAIRDSLTSRLAALRTRLASAEAERDVLKEERHSLVVAWDATTDKLARAEAERDALREVLRETHGVAQSMADMDSWIAGQAGMEHDDEWTFFVPVARAALSTYDEGEGGAPE